MVDGGFQEEAEARAKYDRARLSSTQLVTYFVGSMQMWDIERDRRRALAAASGDPRGADAVPEPRVVGGFGETPGLRLPGAPRGRDLPRLAADLRCSGGSSSASRRANPSRTGAGSPSAGAAASALFRTQPAASTPRRAGPRDSRLLRLHVLSRLAVADEPRAR